MTESNDQPAFLNAVESIAAPSEPASLEPEFHQLSPKYVVFEQRTGYVGFAILAIVAASIAVGLMLAWQSTWSRLAIGLAWVLLVCGFIFVAHHWPKVKFRHIRWRLAEQGMEIQTGVWWKHRIAIPVARVQHVDVSQGPVQRMFELGTLEIHTAGTKNASVQLEGLAHSTALDLRDQLIAQKESLHAE